jgi:hypothetical protein
MKVTQKKPAGSLRKAQTNTYDNTTEAPIN